MAALWRACRGGRVHQELREYCGGGAASAAVARLAPDAVGFRMHAEGLAGGEAGGGAGLSWGLGDVQVTGDMVFQAVGQPAVFRLTYTCVPLSSPLPRARGSPRAACTSVSLDARSCSPS